MKKTLATLAILSVGIIAGCGSSTTQATTVSRTVAHGYLQNAMVFLDKNFNYQLIRGSLPLPPARMVLTLSMWHPKTSANIRWWP